MSYTNSCVAIVPKLPLPSQSEILKNANKTIPLAVPQKTQRWSTTILDNIKHLVEKVKQVALFILKASLSAFLYWMNPSFFAMGFVGGIAFDEKVQHLVEKIQAVWKHLSCFEAAVGCFFCGLSLPVTMVTTTLLWSAYLGAKTYQNSSVTSSDERLQKHVVDPIG